jgi:hypothetical protein
MKFKTKYSLCLLKSYFDKGFALTNYFKYIIAFIGLASKDIKNTLLIAFVYAIFCFILGYFWFKSDFILAEIEVGNKYNLFVKEMRKKFSYSVQRKV